MGVASMRDPESRGAKPEPVVLVIDPNQEHQVLSTVALGRRGFRVTIASTAREGLRLALSQTFAAIVLDVKVRDLPALEVLHVLRERLPDVPKILAVPMGQEQSAVRALSLGASGYLVKTARYNELLPSEVEAQIRAAEARRSLKEQTKALGESEERFQKAFRASPVALSIVTRAEGRFVDANDAFLNLLGVRREDIVGKTADEAEIHLDPETQKRMALELRDSGSLRETPVPFMSRSGEPRIGAASMETIEIEGQPCILAMLRDVTEERRGEQLRVALYEISEATSAARDLSELFPIIQRSVASLMPAENFYIALYDPATDVIEFPYFVDEKEPTPAPYKAGPGLTEYVLRTGESLLVTPEIFDSLVAAGKVESVGAAGVDWLGVPLSIAEKTFGVLAVQSYAETTRYTEEDRTILSMVSAQVALAIDRKRSEEGLRRAEARFRTVFESAPMGVALADTEGRLRETNPAIERMLGRSSEELRGMHVLDITFPDDVGQTLRFLQELVKGENPRLQYEKRYLRKDGTWFWGRLTAALMKAQPPEPTLLVAILEDVTEAKESLEAREKDARRFQTLIAKITDGISLVGPDGTVRWQSPSAEAMFGYPAEEAIGRSALEFIHPDDMEQLGTAFVDLMSTPGRTIVAEVRIRHKDGSWRWMEVAGTNLLQDQDLHAVVFNYRDITQRNEALEQIRFQASLLSHVRNAVFSTDADFHIVYWNDYAATLFGWKSSEVQGKYIGDFMGSTQARSQFDALAQTIRESGHWEGEGVMANKHGTSFHTSLTVSPLQDRLGRLIGFVGVASDITGRVKAEKALEARARQQAAIAVLGQKALAEPSVSGFMNEALAALAGTLSVENATVLELAPDRGSFVLRAKYGSDLALGTRTPNRPEESLAAYAMTTNGPVILENAATETRFKVPTFVTERNLLSGICVVIPGHDKTYGVLSAQAKNPRAFSEDDVNFVTSVATVVANAIERSRIEKALAENERLASMGQLASYVAHEINTPLTNISLLASNIARREKDPEILHKLEEIGEQRRKATAIITDLVNIPRQPAFRRVPEDLRTVIAAAVEQVAPFRKPDVSLVVDTREHALFANINTIQIRDVFVNLLRNALQATSHGTVTVRLSEIPEYLFISVEDTGTGMAPELLQQLFHPLYGMGAQGETSLLGLAVSRNIVAAHGGKIEATSEAGKGSTFTVILPRYEAR
jgi:PAS domain S-box-containing protein